METIRLFLESLNGFYSQDSILGYESDLKNFGKYIFKRTETDYDKINDMQDELKIIKQLNEADIVAYITYLKNEKQNKQITVNRKISALKQYFKFMKANHYIVHDIVYDIKVNKVNACDTEILTLEECRTLLNKISGRNKRRDTLIFMLFLVCGLTVNELIYMEKTDIDGEKIFIRKNNGNQEFMYINDALKSILSDYLSLSSSTTSKYLFSPDGEKNISKRTIHQLIVKHLKSAGLYKKGMTTENLRKTGAAFLMNHCELDLFDLQRYMGHKNILSTKNLLKHQMMIEREQLNKNPLAKI